MTKNIKQTQNFLTSKQMLHDLVKKMNLKKNDYIFELGVGKGHLTETLSQSCSFITGLELDQRLVTYSRKKFESSSQIRIIKQDILEFDYPRNKNYKIVGNIPFNISTAIVKKIVFNTQATHAYLIVEDGFAKRMMDKSRTLSLLLMPYADVNYLQFIGREYFHPMPIVNCALIEIKRHPNLILEKHQQEYTYFVSKWVNQEYKKLFTSNQLKKALKYGEIKNSRQVNKEQMLSLFNSYLLFKN